MKKIIILMIMLTSLSVLGASSREYIGLDVRSPQELVANPAPEAVHIPLSNLNSSTVTSLPKDKEIRIFCEAGVRAARALNILKSQGFKNIKNIGSWREWNKLSHSK